MTPLTGRTSEYCQCNSSYSVGEHLLADMYIDLLANVNSSRSISVRLFSNSLVEATGVLQPTPLCHIAYDTLFFPAGTLGSVNSEKNRRSMSVSMISWASGLASSNSGSPSVGVCSGSASSNSTSVRSWPRLLRFLLAPQKNLSSHASR